MLQRPRPYPHLRGWRVLALLAALLLLASASLLGAGPGRAQIARDVVECSATCDQAELESLVAAAGTPTRIVMPDGEIMLTGTLALPVGSDIELVSRGVSTLSRQAGFTGTMVRIPAGAALTLGADGGQVDIDSRGTVQRTSSTTVEVRGALTMEAGEIRGARGGSGAYRGAGVTVTGAGATFVLNGGRVTDNQRAQGSGNPQNGAGNVAVHAGGAFVMNGGEVSRGWGSGVTGASYGEAGGIGAYFGGTVEINDGLITDNQGWAGGILGFTWHIGANRQRIEDTAESSRNHIVINGGEISGNRAGFSGGGLFVFGNGVAEMNGGTITGNTAPNGGGVGTMDLYVAGADRTWDEVPFDGKNLGYTAEEWAELSPAAFTMNGGEITDNHVTRTGGGVNVISNRVRLLGGRIADNTAGNQGGGIYVATVSYATYLENVLVSDNEASWVGGGIWACPTGIVELRVNEGGAVFDNRLGAAASHGQDLGHDNLGSVGGLEMWLANRMVGGGEVGWYWDNPEGSEHGRFDPADPGERQDVKGEIIMQKGFATIADAGAKDAARTAASLTISGNSAPRGGGIGTNGAVYIGYGDPVDAEVVKSWTDATGDVLPDDELPGSASMVLKQATVSAAEWDEIVDPVTGEINPLALQYLSAVDFLTFEVRADQDWRTVLEDLPETNAEGARHLYFVEEITMPGFDARVEPSWQQVAPTGEDDEMPRWRFAFSVTNRADTLTTTETPPPVTTTETTIETTTETTVSTTTETETTVETTVETETTTETPVETEPPETTTETETTVETETTTETEPPVTTVETTTETEPPETTSVTTVETTTETEPPVTTPVTTVETTTETATTTEIEPSGTTVETTTEIEPSETTVETTTESVTTTVTTPETTPETTTETETSVETVTTTDSTTETSTSTGAVPPIIPIIPIVPVVPDTSGPSGPPPSPPHTGTAPGEVPPPVPPTAMTTRTAPPQVPPVGGGQSAPPSESTLARTGTEALVMGGVALALCAIGAGMVAAVRRRE